MIFSSVLGTVALVFYTFPLLGIIFAPMVVLYYLVSMYYRRTSIETKRIDSLMRSILYASFSGESKLLFYEKKCHLTMTRNYDGPCHYSSIPWTGEFSFSMLSFYVLNFSHQDRAVKDAERGLDLENRAYYMTISIQRWLTLRLDMFGNVLILGIALFAAGFRHTVDPAKIGVVLSYTLSSEYRRA